MNTKRIHHLTTPIESDNGSIIVSILVVTLFLTSIIFSYIVLASANVTRARNRVMLLQAQYAAESGADVAISQLNNVSETYSGSGGEVIILTNNQYKSTYSVSVVDGATDKERVITATGKVYSPKTLAQASHTRTIEVIAQRTSTTTSTSIVSRNIVE